MFDSFFFAEGALPDNKVPADHEFQSNDLDCSLDKYYVEADGTMKKYDFWEQGHEDKTSPCDKPINTAAYVYSHEFMYEGTDILTRKYLGCRYQEYKLVIVNSKIAHVEKIKEEGYEDGI